MFTSSINPNRAPKIVARMALGFAFLAAGVGVGVMVAGPAAGVEKKTLPWVETGCPTARTASAINSARYVAINNSVCTIESRFPPAQCLTDGIKVPCAQLYSYFGTGCWPAIGGPVAPAQFITEPEAVGNNNTPC